MIDQSESGPFFLNRLIICRRYNGNIAALMEHFYTFLHTFKRLYLFLWQLFNGGIYRLRPGQGFFQTDISGLFYCFLQSRIGQFIGFFHPFHQCFQSFYRLVFFQYFRESLHQSFKTVDPSCHGIEIYLIPAFQKLLLISLQPPLFYHAGTKTPEVFNIHTVNGTAV